MVVFAHLCGCHHAVRKQPLSTLHMADPAAAGQLVTGFYGVESNSWRWTAKRFVVTLLPPKGSDVRGGLLRMHIVIPDAQFKRLGPVTVSVDADDINLESQTFPAAGDYNYLSEVPASILRTNLLPVIFTLDKAAAPSTTDGRELGAVVSEISLQTK